MNNHDFALVVGIEEYPGLTTEKIPNPQGAENDAMRFYRWLTGVGQVPDTNITRLLSSSGGTTAVEIGAQLKNYVTIGEERQKNQGTRRIGRRLYLFMAGHGFEPEKDEPALLASDATLNLPEHIAGRFWAEGLLSHGYFEEVLLFMDCCRSIGRKVPLNRPALVDMVGQNALFYFYGFAAKPPLTTVAKPFPPPNGQLMGIFTSTLLGALEGAAKDPTGKVTAFALKDHLYLNMGAHLTEQEKSQGDISEIPEVDCPKNPKDNFLIINLGAQKYPIRITLEHHTGETALLRDGMLQPVKQWTVQADEEVQTVDLLPGLYQVLLEPSNMRTAFDVPGGGPDVRF